MNNSTEMSMGVGQDPKGKENSIGVLISRCAFFQSHENQKIMLKRFKT